jgi:hypothetical protein
MSICIGHRRRSRERSFFATNSYASVSTDRRSLKFSKDFVGGDIFLGGHRDSLLGLFVLASSGSIIIQITPITQITLFRFLITWPLRRTAIAPQFEKLLCDVTTRDAHRLSAAITYLFVCHPPLTSDQTLQLQPITITIHIIIHK